MRYSDRFNKPPKINNIGGFQMGLFDDNAPKYFERKPQLNVVPIKPGTQAPKDNGWQRYSTEAVTESTQEMWLNSRSDWGIGLPLGPFNDLIALDVDTTNEDAIAVVKSMIPPSPLIKFGSKGFTAFYRYNGETNRSLSVLGNQTVLELLSTGKQTVLPPTIHSKTGQPYKWLSRDQLPSYDGHVPVLPKGLFDEVFRMIKPILENDMDLIERALKDNTAGRNNALKHFVFQNIESMEMSELILATITKDRMDNKLPLFEDPDEIPGSNALERATRFINSLYKFLQRKKKAKGEKLLSPTDPNFGWTTKKDDFHFNVSTGSKPVWKLDFDGICEFLREKHGIVCDQSYFYTYTGTHYKPTSDEDVKVVIRRLLGKKYAPAKTKEVMSALLETNQVGALEMITPRPGLLNLKNGVLDVITRDLMPHDPKLYFKYCVPAEYDAGATCEKWREFVDETMVQDLNMNLGLQMLFGYCLEGGDPWLHKAFFLIGDGRNGKGVVTAILERLVGIENVSHVSLSALNEPFATIAAKDKLVNTITEGEINNLSAEAFKTAVAGEAMRAGQKYKPEIYMRFQARLVVSANDYPRFRDSSVGNTSRMYIIPFNHFVEPTKRDPHLVEKLERELPGILLWALEGLSRLKASGQLPTSPNQQVAEVEYMASNDSVVEWADTVFMPIDKDEAPQPFMVGKFYENYRSFTTSGGRHPVSKIGFCKNLVRFLKAKYDADDKQHTRVGTVITAKAKMTDDAKREMADLT